MAASVLSVLDPLVPGPDDAADAGARGPSFLPKLTAPKQTVKQQCKSEWGNAHSVAHTATTYTPLLLPHHRSLDLSLDISLATSLALSHDLSLFPLSPPSVSACVCDAARVVPSQVADLPAGVKLLDVWLPDADLTSKACRRLATSGGSDESPDFW